MNSWTQSWAGLRPGDLIVQRMGVRIVGRVLRRMPSRDEYSDGSYRAPEVHERSRAVPVRWTDGSVGWILREHVAPVPAEVRAEAVELVRELRAVRLEALLPRERNRAVRSHCFGLIGRRTLGR